MAPTTSTAEQPLPVRTVSRMIAGWIARLGRVWIEGQVAEVNRRGGTCFLTIRDPEADISLRATCRRQVLDSLTPPLAEGARVVVWAQPQLWPQRGDLQLEVYEIRPLGVGELLARLERLKQLLAAEGLFAADRKQQVPFLPATVGLVCGRGSAAERDVLENSRARWPALRFRIEAVPVQGTQAVTEVMAAVSRLDRDADVEVIVIARGGGSVEDLLPFSDEALCRAVSRCKTPVVSAIGHEQDTPLLDFVADVRASTPTDVAKRIVPSVEQESELVGHLRARATRAVAGQVQREEQVLSSIRSRPAIADPLSGLLRRHEEVQRMRGHAHRSTDDRLTTAFSDLEHVRHRVRALSPAATLARGYAVVQRRSDGGVVRAPQDVQPAAVLDIRVAGGRLTAVAQGSGAVE